jgi:hypothetical protein
MDLSKLPKLSNTPQPPTPENPPMDDPSPTANPPSLGRSLIDVWISVGVGVFLLLWQPRFLQWLFSRLFHTHFDEFMLDGNIVPYQTLPEFWSDLGPALFAIVLIADGLLILTRRRALVWAAFVLTLATTAFNLVWCVESYWKYGFAPLSFLAVIIGGWIMATQWRMLQPNRLSA